MNVFRRSWDLTRVTFGVINKDKELFGFQITGIIMSLFFLIFFIGAYIFLGVISLAGEINISAFHYFMIFILYFGLAFINAFFSVCVVYTSGTRFNGGDATFGESIGFAFKRIEKIFLWAIVSSTVGLILKAIENLAKRIKVIGAIIIFLLNSLIGFAWSISTIFVLQGIVYKDIGPFSAIKDSVITLRKTWGESLIKYLGFGTIEFLIIFFGFVLFVPISILAFVNSLWFIGLLFIGLLMIYWTITVLTFNIANQVYNTALYVYANTGRIPGGYSEEHMQGVFKTKKEVLGFR